MRLTSTICVMVLLVFSIQFSSIAAAASNRFFDYSSGRKTVGVFSSFSDDINYYFVQARTKPASTFEIGIKGGMADLSGKGKQGTGAYLGLDGNLNISTMESSPFLDIFIELGFSSIIKSRRAHNEFFFGPAGEKTLSESDSLTIKGVLGIEGAISGGSLFNDEEFDIFLKGGLIVNVGEAAHINLELKGGTDFVGGLGVNFEF